MELLKEGEVLHKKYELLLERNRQKEEENRVKEILEAADPDENLFIELPSAADIEKSLHDAGVDPHND